jgi:hypothetical protein
MVIQDLIEESFAVTIPRNLVIENKRLGLLYRILQAFFIIALLSYCLFVEPWRAYDTPVAAGLRAWCAASSGDASADLENAARHCDEPSTYHSTDPSKGSESLHPNSCRKLHFH